MRIIFLFSSLLLYPHIVSAQYATFAAPLENREDAKQIEQACKEIINQAAFTITKGEKDEAVIIGPLRDPLAAECYFGDGFRTLRSAALLFQDGTGVLAAETFSDIGTLPIIGRIPFIGKIFGYGRYGIGFLVQGGEVESDSSAASSARFMDGGGNISFYYASPIVSWHNGPKGKRSTSTLDVLFAPRSSAIVSGLNATATDASYNVDIAAEARIRVISIQEIFEINSKIRTGRVMGSQDFYNSVGEESPFGYMTLEIEMDVAKQYRIRIRKGLAGPDALREAPVSIGVQIIPRALDNKTRFLQ